MPKQTILRQKASKYTIELVLCWLSAAGHGVIPSVWFICPVRYNWRNVIIPLFLVEECGLIFSSLLSPGTPSGLDQCRPCLLICSMFLFQGHSTSLSLCESLHQTEGWHKILRKMKLAVHTPGMSVVGLSLCEEGVWSGVAQQTNRNEDQEANRKERNPDNISARRHSTLCEALV